MFRFFKRKKQQHNDANDQSSAIEQNAPVEDAPEVAEEPASGEVAPDTSGQQPDEASEAPAAPETIEERVEEEPHSPQTAPVEPEPVEEEQAVSRSDDLHVADEELTVEEPAAEQHEPARQREEISSPSPVETSSEPSQPQEEAPLPETARESQPEVTPETPPDAAVASASEHSAPSSVPAPEPAPAAPEPVQQSDEKSSRGGFFSRIRKGLSKTRSNLTGGLATLFLGEKEIDDELIEDLETQLLVADIGVEATTEIIDRLTERVSRKELSSASSLYKALQEELTTILAPVEQPLQLPPKGQGPFVILVIGVNGVGKTTTIGKLAKRFRSEGRSVMLAAGDTFRAAAVEQLKVWGERNDVPVVAQHTGADSASVIYDALSAARARNVDVLIADTAGRLHNKAHLMEELKKVRRVMGKLDESAPHEVMLVVDAGTGQNAISQAETFSDAVPITGVVMTKLDGTAKGGVIFAMAKQTGIPIRYIGVGESLEDLRPFEAKPFTDALFDERA